MEDKSVALLTEQLQHANHMLQAQIKALDARVSHLQAMNQQRLVALEEDSRDHETRIRAATEGVTQFKLFSGLASGGSGLMSLVALLRTFLGG
jgi:multidrug resistance efflux pump